MSLTVPDWRVHLVIYRKAKTTTDGPERAELTADILAVARSPGRLDSSIIVGWLEENQHGC